MEVLLHSLAMLGNPLFYTYGQCQDLLTIHVYKKQSCQPPPPPPNFFGWDLHIFDVRFQFFLVRWRATCRLSQATFFLWLILKGYIPESVAISISWNLLQILYIYNIYIYIIYLSFHLPISLSINYIYIYYNTLFVCTDYFLTDFNVDLYTVYVHFTFFSDIPWNFGRAWDLAKFCEFHKKFVRFGTLQKCCALICYASEHGRYTKLHWDRSGTWHKDLHARCI